MTFERGKAAMTRHVVGWDEVEATAAPGGLTKRRIGLPGMSLVTVQVPGGTRGTRHSHDHDQFVQVVSGSGTLETEQGERAEGGRRQTHHLIILEAADRSQKVRTPP